MNKITERLLIEVGWYQNRNHWPQELIEVVIEYENLGFKIFDAAIKILKKYSGLVLPYENTWGTEVKFIPLKDISQKQRMFNEYNLLGLSDASLYLKRPLFPIAITSGGFWNVLCDQEGSIYTLGHGLFYAADTIEDYLDLIALHQFDKLYEMEYKDYGDFLDLLDKQEGY
jgi:SUKH-3 immunity protein